MKEPGTDAGGRVPLLVTSGELELLRTALELLEDTLGREEAEELAEVQALLARLKSTAIS